MKQKVVPTLTAAGWVTNIVDKLDFLATYIFLSNYSQSNVYSGKIVSVQWMIQEYGNDLDNLRQQMSIRLQEYFKRHFDEAIVSVERSSQDDPNSNKVTLSLVIDVYDKDLKHSLAYAVSTENSRFRSFTKLNNEG